MPKTTYTRKLSDDEAVEGYIMVLKDALSLFPKVGKPFKLRVGGKEIESRVRAVQCWCMGPGKPHEHYRIDGADFQDVLPLRWGLKVTIEKVGDNDYQLSAVKK